MQAENGAVSGPFIWNHWSVEVPFRSRRVLPRRGSSVRVLPGNPSLPLRVMLGEMSRRMNGGLNGTALGIDLGARGHEVRKLFYAGGFTGTLVRENIDPEEFLQEVYRGLLARNRGTCPWDAKKSSFGHYVHIVIRCVLSNYLRRERLRDSREGVTEDGELPAVAGSISGGGGTEFRDLLEALYGEGEERDQAERFLSALYAGMSRREALSAAGGREEWGHRVLAEVRSALNENS